MTDPTEPPKTDPPPPHPARVFRLHTTPEDGLDRLYAFLRQYRDASTIVIGVIDRTHNVSIAWSFAPDSAEARLVQVLAISNAIQFSLHDQINLHNTPPPDRNRS